MDRGAEGQTVPCAPARWAAMVDSMLQQSRVHKNEEAVCKSLDMRADSARQGRSADSAHPRSARWIEAQMGKLCPVRPLDGRQWSMTCLSSPGCKKTRGLSLKVLT